MSCNSVVYHHVRVARRRWPSLAMAVAASLVGWSSAAQAQSCDRSCLAKALDGYLSAIVNHSPADAHLAPSFRGTENASDVAPGQGLWISVNGLGALQRRYYDPQSQQAGYYGTVGEAGGPALVALRIRVRGREITEAEAIVSRPGDRLFNAEGTGINPPGDDAPARPSSSGEMIGAVDAYFDHMQAHSGEGVQRRPGCVRLENGSGGAKVAGGAPDHDCATGFERLLQISAVGHRHFGVVDRSAGVVMATAMFLRPPGATMPDGKLWKRNLFIDVFTFDQGLVTGVYGVMHALDSDRPESTGWPDRAKLEN